MPADAATYPENRRQRLKRLAEENLADELVIEPARKRIKARDIETLKLLQVKEPGKLKAEEPEKLNHVVEPATQTQASEPLSSFFQMFKSFKKDPPFADKLHCLVCFKTEPERPILAACAHIFCTPCFQTKVYQTVNRAEEIKSFICRESHWISGEIAHGIEIGGYVELNADELAHLKRMFEGEDIDIHALAARHKPDPNQYLRNLWNKLIAR